MRILKIALFLFLSGGIAAQQGALRPACADKAFDQEVANSIAFTVPVISCKDLKEMQNDVYIFDTRKTTEYNVSHIPGAERLGYMNLNMDLLDEVPKDAKIVLYCSIGYRSEKIGEKLRKKGFKNVYNLYGSIFEWANLGYPLHDEAGNKTKTVHTYNKKWSKWVDDSKSEKVW